MAEVSGDPGGMSESTVLASGTTAVQVDAVSRGLLSGGVWQIAGQAVTLTASMVATPVVIRQLGPSGYGLLALVNVLVGYLAFADLGMVEASSKFGADRAALGDDDGEVRVVWTSLLLAAGAAGAGSVALVVGAPAIVDHVLSLPAHLRHDGVLALRIAAIGFLARAVSGVLNTSEIVRMRWDVNVSITSGFATLQVLAVPAVLLLSGGVVAAVVVASAVAVVTAVAHFVASARLQPATWPPRVDRALVGPLARFGGATMAGYALFVLLLNVDRLFIARYGSVAEVGYYSVAATLAALVNVVTFAVSRPLLPGFATLLAEGDRDGAARVYGRVYRLLVVLSVPMVLAVAAIGRPFLSVWAGHAFGERATVPLVLLVIGVAVDAVGYVPSNLLYASHRAARVLLFHIIELGPYLVAAVIVIPRWGMTGAATVWLARAVVNSTMYSIAAGRELHARQPLSIRSFSRVIVGSLPLAPLVVVALTGAGLVIAGLATLACVAAYFVMSWRLVVDDDDRAWIRSLVRRS